jgi:predicted AlkP superfamily pyrophosphatase or phosphodiesterase
MRRTCVIDMPGLSHDLLSAIPAQSSLGKWLATQPVAALTPSWPAVTCSVQATLTTGVPPARHGIIANGIATFRSAEDQKLIDASNFAEYRGNVSFWEQSNQFLQAPRFWQGKYKTALLFLQHSMPGFVPPFKPAADIVITPKPEHGPDGKIASLLWAEPQEMVPQLFRDLGPFPLMKYWGPIAGIESSRWIAQASAWVWERQSPELQFAYIPHLDYDLQRFGPASAQATKSVVDTAQAVEPLVDAVLGSGGELILLSEYGMKPVSRFVQPNQLLTDAGLLMTRKLPDGRLIDYAASRAFAMVDHQIAHVYLREQSDAPRACEVLQANPAIHARPRDASIDHARSGDLILEAAPDAWFDYRWWKSPDEAPVFAKDVDIHRKPGYDPLELLFDPSTRGVSQDAARIRGSHGAATAGEAVFIGRGADGFDSRAIEATQVAALVERSMDM